MHFPLGINFPVHYGYLLPTTVETLSVAKLSSGLWTRRKRIFSLLAFCFVLEFLKIVVEQEWWEKGSGPP